MRYEMDNTKYDMLLKIIKFFKKKTNFEFPDYGTQNFHDIVSKEDPDLIFKLLINRKGHVRENSLSYQMSSLKFGPIVRLDMTGPAHDSKDGFLIETPHVHIFDERHNNGRWAIPLSEINDEKIINVLYDSLIIFLLYNNVDTTNVNFPII